MTNGLQLLLPEVALRKSQTVVAVLQVFLAFANYLWARKGSECATGCVFARDTVEYIKCLDHPLPTNHPLLRLQFYISFCGWNCFNLRRIHLIRCFLLLLRMSVDGICWTCSVDWRWGDNVIVSRNNGRWSCERDFTHRKTEPNKHFPSKAQRCWLAIIKMPSSLLVGCLTYRIVECGGSSSSSSS